MFQTIQEVKERLNLYLKPFLLEFEKIGEGYKSHIHSKRYTYIAKRKTSMHWGRECSSQFHFEKDCFKKTVKTLYSLKKG